MSSRRFRALLPVYLLLAGAFGAPPAFGALAQRTFVASYGDDSNPCSRALPCRQFSAAIAQTLAGGEVVVLDSTSFGNTVITQSVSVIAPPDVHAIVTTSTLPDCVGAFSIDAPESKVVVKNMTIVDGGGGCSVGIQVLNAAEVEVADCDVSGPDGIHATADNAKLNVRDTVFRGATVFLLARMSAVLERVRVVRSSTSGIWVENVTDVSIRHSVLSGNAGSGLSVSPGVGLARVTVEDSLISDNGNDGISLIVPATGAVEITAVRNTLTRNAGYGIRVNPLPGGSVVASVRDNLISWSLYGVMALGDGAVVTADSNTFANNQTSAFVAVVGATIHTVVNNAGEQATPTLGNVVPIPGF